MMPDLVNSVGSRRFAWWSSRSECEIARAGPHLGVEPRHRFEIVVEDVGPGRDDDLDRAVLAQEIGDQHLDRGRRRGGADRRNRPGEMAGAAVVEIVAVDRGDDDVLETEFADRLGDAPRLMRVDEVGAAGRDVAEGAGAGAHRAEDHYGGVPLLPALADIRAGRLLAHRVEFRSRASAGGSPGIPAKPAP